MPHTDQVPREPRTNSRPSREARSPRNARARRRRLRRQRALALTLLGIIAAALVLVVGNVISSAHVPGPSTGGPRKRADDSPAKPARLGPLVVPANTYHVAVTTLHLVDHSRTITLPGGTVIPRPVTTVLRYPTLKTGAGAQPARADGPFPLIIFGHGFNLLPSAYARLLRYWTSAGFIVAAPIFPLENPNAPGHPNETDLVNQPQDMRFVISSLMHLNARHTGLLSGLIDTHEVAVAGHSDGGDTALALAYDPALRDRHLQAAVILSGAEISAEIPTFPSFTIGPGGPPLLAIQGTADTINLPSATAAFYDPAPAPKYLLQVLGASHLGPYATNRVQLGVVQRVTTAFLQYYLEHYRPARQTMLRAGEVPGVATLQANR